VSGHLNQTYLGNNHHLFELQNGLRIIFTQRKKTMMVHCGILIGSGSRDENDENNGIAHFIEHAVFKGTKKRRSLQILNHLESVGGELNAYTTRERTMYYTASLKKYLGRSFEILTDIVFNPVFPENEIEKEKKVITEEIEMYEDSPEESIFDDFYKQLFRGNSLGYNILGTKDTITSFTKETLVDFWSKNYTTGNMVISVAGNVSLDNVRKVIETYFLDRKSSQTEKKRIVPEVNTHFNIAETKDFQQVHCIIGNKAYSSYDKKRHALSVLNNILGGDWMSSRLNLSVREKHAYAYNIQSSFNLYADSGTFTVQLGTDEKYLDKCIELIHKEFKKLKSVRLTSMQLNRCKRQIMSQYAMYHENTSAVIQIKGRNILDYGRIINEEEFFSHINQINADDVLSVANEVLDDNTLNMLIYKNE